TGVQTCALPISDAKFTALVASASNKGTYFFTFNQLYARYCRGRVGTVAAVIERVLTPSATVFFGLAAGALLGGIMAAIAAQEAIAAIAIVAAVVFFFVALVKRGQRELEPAHRLAADIARLRGWVEKWQRARG